MGAKCGDSWIGAGDTAAYLGVTKDTIRNWIKMIMERTLVKG